MEIFKTLSRKIFYIAFFTTSIARADIIDFYFTGQFTVVDMFGDFVVIPQTPIASTFTFDTVTGVGTSDSFIAPFTAAQLNMVIDDIHMQRIGDTNLILGNMLGTVLPGDDGTGGEAGIPISLIWDATGLFNAIDYGLQANDVISGSSLIRNGNNIFDVSSALPATDVFRNNYYGYNQGPAPLATTTYNPEWLCEIGTPECVGLAISGGPNYTDDGVPGAPILGGSATGFNVNIDIGSGNSLTVLSVSAVPLPAAFWLFITGLIALLGFSRIKKC